MRRAIVAAFILALGATGASAMTRTVAPQPGSGTRAAAVAGEEAVDERLERLAAASTPNDRSHAKPARSVRNILKDDPNLRGAFASLDNK